MFSLWGKYLGMELLDHMASVCFTFKETAKLFSKVAEIFDIPISMYEGSYFSISSPMLVVFFNTTILV
jgi:hypothetical protein